MKDLKNVRYLCLQTLTNFPYIEEDFDALTTYELLCKIVEYLNKVIKNDNEQNTLIKELYDSFVELKDYVDKYLHDVSDLEEKINLINQELVIMNQKISNNTQEIENVRVDLTAIINTNYNTLKTSVDYNDAILDDKITNIEIGSISVYNPTNGLLEPLQEVINDLYANANRDGLTATEFDALELTATQFDAYEITAYEFDSQGKLILV